METFLEHIFEKTSQGRSRPDLRGWKPRRAGAGCAQNWEVPTRLEGMETKNDYKTCVCEKQSRPDLRGWKLGGGELLDPFFCVSRPDLRGWKHNRAAAPHFHNPLVPTRLEGMETLERHPQHHRGCLVPTRLEGMETKITNLQQLKAFLVPTRLEGMET